MKKIGVIKFQDQSLPVWGTFDKPYFMVQDVAKLLGYPTLAKVSETLKGREEDEVITATFENDRDDGDCLVKRRMLTELGLYNTLSRSNKPVARMWRRAVLQQLVDTRKARGLTIEEQFEEWDAMLDDTYIDPVTGLLMISVTVAGGAVEQVPYEK